MPSMAEEEIYIAGGYDVAATSTKCAGGWWWWTKAWCWSHPTRHQATSIATKCVSTRKKCIIGWFVTQLATGSILLLLEGYHLIDKETSVLLSNSCNNMMIVHRMHGWIQWMKKQGYSAWLPNVVAPFNLGCASSKKSKLLLIVYRPFILFLQRSQDCKGLLCVRLLA